MDYSIDLASELAAGDSLLSATWIVEAGIAPGTITTTNTRSTIWLGGGSAKARYLVTLDYTTSAGRRDQLAFWLEIKSAIELGARP